MKGALYFLPRIKVKGGVTAPTDKYLKYEMISGGGMKSYFPPSVEDRIGLSLNHKDNDTNEMNLYVIGLG